MRVLKESFEFEWDKGNTEKNKKHRVGDKEAEEVFFDKYKIIYKDVFHSKNEERFVLIGKTRKNRLLYTVFTKRKSKIRIISIRDTDKKEEKFYEKAT